MPKTFSFGIESITFSGWTRWTGSHATIEEARDCAGKYLGLGIWKKSELRIVKVTHVQSEDLLEYFEV